MRGKKAILGIAVAAAAFIGSAAPASATTVCRDVVIGSPPGVKVCFTAETSLGTATVGARVETEVCIGYLCGQNEWLSVDRTGFTPVIGRLPTFDPVTLTLSYPGGVIGTVWINGEGTPVHVSPFCVGACFEA